DEVQEILPQTLTLTTPGPDEVLDEGLMAYMAEHAAEISEEADKPFQPIGGFYDDFIPGGEEPLSEIEAVPLPESPAAPPASPKKAVAKKTPLKTGVERGSAL